MYVANSDGIGSVRFGFTKTRTGPITDMSIVNRLIEYSNHKPPQQLQI
jgi:hypothetical protein